MGMDVMGKNPTSETGAYFRNNVWGWHPLAEYIVDTYPTLAADCTYWHTNDGDGLDSVGALALADALTRDLESGAAQRAVQARDAYLASLPKEECTLCGGTGVRTDEIGVELGFDVPRDPQTGRGGCNGCQGEGKQARPETWYHFDVENVRAFAAFLRDCGGFEIW